MARQLEAVYEQGILRPLEPLALAEHQHVLLTLEEHASQATETPRGALPAVTEKNPARLSWQSAEPFNERREELRWLARESDPYAGEWVALDGPRLIAHGEKLATVRAMAKAAGVVDPLFASVPREKNVPFGGW